jgi:UDP-N-acetylglucosamine diphosphorylase/glucosamine-1-phosphate N-acetyltransferase
MSHSLLLFDDQASRSWEPFALTRPPGELLFGALLLRERAERFWNSPCSGHLSHESLAGFQEPGAPPVMGPAEANREGTRILQSSRAALQGASPPLPRQATTLFLGGNVVGWVLPPDVPNPPVELLSDPQPLPGSEHLEVTGRLLEAPWELMARNTAQLREDIPDLFPGYAADSFPGCHVMGDGLLSLGSRVHVEPGSVFDVRDGPIRLSDDVVVHAFSRIEGPAYFGPGTTILGGALSEVSVGPVCKVRGEVESTVVLGYSNKAHDGFLGHAYVGRWVNLGASTVNSDLKNNYGPVRVGGPEGSTDTGLLKVGCFLGDHVKTGIGTLLNTGTVVGAGSNLFGGRMPPTYVPPFSWGSGSDLTEFRLDRFFEVAARAMGRRGMELTSEMKDLLGRAWEATRHLRQSHTSP